MKELLLYSTILFIFMCCILLIVRRIKRVGLRWNIYCVCIVVIILCLCLWLGIFFIFLWEFFLDCIYVAYDVIWDLVVHEEYVTALMFLFNSMWVFILFFFVLHDLVFKNIRYSIFRLYELVKSFFKNKPNPHHK